MPRLRPHRLTLLLALATAGIAAVAVLFFRDRFVEEWYVWRLESEDPDVRADAARALAGRKCLRAAPRLVRRIEELQSEAGVETGEDSPFGGVFVFTPLVHALYRLGPEVEDHLPPAPADLRVAATFHLVRRAWGEEEPRVFPIGYAIVLPPTE